MPDEDSYPGRWMKLMHINEEQYLLTADQIRLLAPRDEYEETENGWRRLKSPEDDHDPGEGEDPMEKMVFVHFCAGCFDFWVYRLDTEDGLLIGYARFLGCGPGQWCSVHHNELWEMRIPVGFVAGKLKSIPVSREVGFTPKPLREAMASQD